jgi:hypothetical protein|tara:strand:+ start:496 stop:705 length:210 start_codon:yes stop_codon:yes gene_type:complete
MNNIVKLKANDPVIERFLSSHDKLSIRKTLAFEYFNNDLDALNQYIDIHIFKENTLKMLEPKRQLEFVF